MTDKIPEALAVLDTCIHEMSWHSDLRAKQLGKARAAFADLIQAVNDARGYGSESWDNWLIDKVDDSLAAVEKLP